MKMDSERFLIDQLLVEMTSVDGNSKQNPNERVAEGGYYQKSEEFMEYFSDMQFCFNKVFVETEWVMFLLVNLMKLDFNYEFIKDEAVNKINGIYEELKLEDYQEIKRLEKCNENAIQDFLVSKFRELELGIAENLIHFGCTNDDIDNIANSLMISDSIHAFFIIYADKLLLQMAKMADKYKDVVMVTDNRTQTTFGKEIMVYVYRLYSVAMNILNIKPTAKFAGSAGNYLEMIAAFPSVNWISMCSRFVEDNLEMEYLSVVSEIETYDYATKVVDLIRQFNNILKEFNSTIRLYCQMGCLVKLRTKRVNVDRAIFDCCEDLLNISTQACVKFSNGCSQTRNFVDIGTAIDYSVRAVKETIKNLKKISVNYEVFAEELKDDWSLLEKTVNTAFSVHGVKNAFDQLKASVGDREITIEDFRKFIKDSTVLEDEQKEFLVSLSPTDYIGYGELITGEVFRRLMGDSKKKEDDNDSEQFCDWNN